MKCMEKTPNPGVFRMHVNVKGCLGGSVGDFLIHFLSDACLSELSSHLVQLYI